MSGGEFVHDADRDAEEGHFRRLYDRVLNHFLEKYNIPEEIMHEAISSENKPYKYTLGHHFSEIDYNRKEMILGYIFRYAPHGAGLARFKILEALNNCSELQHILKKPHLNVVSLGGGPGNDMVGFCSAINRTHFTGSLRIDVVDTVPEWEQYVTMVENLLRQGGFGDASDFFQRRELELNFIERKIPSDFAMDEYDVLLICKLFSILYYFKEKEEFVKSLYARMNESALILLIDCPFEDHFWRGFEVLYISNEQESYKSGPTVERFGHNDKVKTDARIAVLKKKKQLSGTHFYTHTHT